MKVLVTIPRKSGDPTSYTSVWGEKIVQNIHALGYDVKTLRGSEVDYEHVSMYLYQNRPRMFIHIGHGCPQQLVGQNECVVTEGMIQKQEGNQFCKPPCDKYRNVSLLNGTIVYTISCYSGMSLARACVNEGCTCYVGYDEELLFPVDNRNTDSMFRDIHMTFINYLLSGDTVEEAEKKMSENEDWIITNYKPVKYISLTTLWNKKHRVILGDRGARVWQ